MLQMGGRTWLVVLGASIVIGCYFYLDGFDPESLRGARVIITGCSSGIGEQMAYHYARLGAKVVITARREARLKEVVAKMKDLGAQEAIYVAGDMGKSEDCERTIQTAKEKFGGLDYLVLNHMGSSYNKGGPFLWDGDMAFLEDFTNINYLSYVRLASLALPMLEQSNGSVVVVSSLLGKIAGTFGSFYSGAKFALDGFFSSLRQELQLKKANVTITLAVLGLIDTELSMNSAKIIGIENLAKITALSAEDAAMAIIRSGAVRQRELYYPWSMVWPLSTLRAFFPQLLDWMEMQKFLI
ncbi:hydroxysteroid 11-beta-dehydrogenase 1-like protein [Branchiostoma floridae x Branchiostoma japonicum]